MSTQIQYRRGTGAQNDVFVGAQGEITVDTTNETLRVHDGINTGGSTLETKTGSQVIKNHANGAFDKANSANVLAQSSYDFANTTSTYAQAAFDKANSGGIVITDNTTRNADTYYPALSNNSIAGTVVGLTVSSSKLYYNPSTGQLNATNFNSLSDKNLKKNVITLDNAVDKIIKLRGVSFDWKDTNIHSIGVIAQEVEEVLPEVVSTNKDGEKSVNYGNIVGLLIEAIKDQQKQIEELKAKVK